MTARQLRRREAVATGPPLPAGALLPPIEDVVPWQAYALCAETDPEIFFPEKGASIHDARKICRACGVRRECLEFALRHDERYGVWGGKSERERRVLRRARRSTDSKEAA